LQKHNQQIFEYISVIQSIA